MRALVQRVLRARVTVAGDDIATIGPGLLVFVAVHPYDDDAAADWLADRVAGLRIFADDRLPMNRSLRDVGGQALVVSQFTLAGDTRRGRRPSFSGAAPPALAESLYGRLVLALRALGVPTQQGRFGADMQVELVNDGPVTLLVDTPGP
jgi:D-tyrosyl-tRNA(Tyr) deacylase